MVKFGKEDARGDDCEVLEADTLEAALEMFCSTCDEPEKFAVFPHNLFEEFYLGSLGKVGTYQAPVPKGTRGFKSRRAQLALKTRKCLGRVETNLATSQPLAGLETSSPSSHHRLYLKGYLCLYL